MAPSLVHRVVRTARAVRTTMRQPPYVAPGHFYSPLTTDADVDRAIAWAQPDDQPLPGVAMDVGKLLALAKELGDVLHEPVPGPRYRADNVQYGAADAAVYRAMLRNYRPARLIEVGSGFSTAVALDEAEREMPALSITCIEPYPERLLAQLRADDQRRLTLLRKPVQDVPVSTFSHLGNGDFLFIDSTHVVKAGSDVTWLFLKVLPTLAPGVIVHVHDIFWPFEYPEAWLREHRDWTEDYLLHAFLMGNRDWEVLWFSSWLWRFHPELIPARLADQRPGSIWLRRTGTAP
jgi:hypothetical protein